LPCQFTWAVYRGPAQESAQRVDLVVGTPGRVIDHIRRKSLILKDIEIVVLDEAMKCSIWDLSKISRQSSAKSLRSADHALFCHHADRDPHYFQKYMNKPKHVHVDASAMIVPKVKQAFYEVREEDKIKALTRLVDVEGPSLTLVFSAQKGSG